MMLSKVLRELKQKKMPAKTDGKGLFIKRGVLSDQYVEEIERYKNEIIAYLTNAEQSIIVFSQILEREIEVSWSDKDPQVVYVDFVPYGCTEIREIRNTKKATVLNLHQLKDEFSGTILTSDYDNHTRSRRA